MQRISLIAAILLFVQIGNAKTTVLKTPQGGSFSVVSTDGMTTSRDLLGKHFFLIFGFLKCPDVCPVTLENIRLMTKKINEDEKASFRYLFVSVDNERDSIADLERLKNRHGNLFIGATDQDTVLKELAANFGAYFRRFKNVKNQSVVEHTDSIFHINPEGKWIGTIPYGATPDDMLKEIRKTQLAPTQGQASRVLKELGANTRCDLSIKDCSIKVGKQDFNVRLLPRPIRTQKGFAVEVETLGETYAPVEADFEGEEINMGFIRPSLTLIKDVYRSGEIQLPVCELSKMRWAVRLVIRDDKGHQSILRYSLTTNE